MTCLTVSNTIHPINTPTGTVADMGGNDKLKPSDLNDWKIPGGFAATSCWVPDKSGRGFAFYDTSGGGMHHHSLRKTLGVAEGRYARERADRRLSSESWSGNWFGADPS